MSQHQLFRKDGKWVALPYKVTFTTDMLPDFSNFRVQYFNQMALSANQAADSLLTMSRAMGKTQTMIEGFTGLTDC